MDDLDAYLNRWHVCCPRCRQEGHKEGCPDCQASTQETFGDPLADASRYEPVNGRGREWLSIRCPYCKGVHLARLRPGAKPGGPRRTPCDRVFVVVRRTYAPRVSTPSERAA